MRHILAEIVCDCHSFSLFSIIISRDINLTDLCTFHILLNHSIYYYYYYLYEISSCMSRCHFCIFHGHILSRYDFHFVYSFDVIPIIMTIYVVFFIFFRLGTYSSEQAQIAGSTKPLTAQRRRFLHRYHRYYRFHYLVHPPPLVRCHMHGPTQISEKRSSFM